MVVLHTTLSPLKREERNKLNENWQRIVEGFRLQQSQLNFLAGGKSVDEIIERIETVISNGESTIADMEELEGLVEGKILEINNAISTSAATNTSASNLINEMNLLKTNLNDLSTKLQNDEQTRMNQEQGRIDSEVVRENQEESRVLSEQERMNSESIRASQEEARVLSEQERVNAESIRAEQEEARVLSEQNRKNKDLEYEESEAIRASQEEARVLAEGERVIAYDTLIDLLRNMKPFPYDPTAYYIFPNLVMKDGSTYMVLPEEVPITGVEPSDDRINYILVARKGTDGSGSVQMVNGIGPDENGNVIIDIGTGSVKTVNGIAPDEDGNVTIDAGTGSVKKVNGLDPDGDGNVTLAYENIEGLEEKIDNMSVIVKQEEFVSVEGQTLFELKEGSYTINQNRIKVYIGGVPQDSPNHFEETSNTSITLVEPISAGLDVLIEYFEDFSPITNYAVKTVNGIEPDQDGNIEVVTSGGVKTVNGSAPDEDGNVEVDTSSVKSVNGFLPSQNGDISLESRHVDGDWNNATETGVWTSWTGTELNSPVFGEFYIGTVFKHDDSWIIQKITRFDSDAMETYVRRKSASEWSPWVKDFDGFSHVAKRNWVNLTLLNGWQGIVRFQKDGHGTIYVEIQLSTVGSTSARTTIATLPVGYRPAYGYSALAYKGNISPYNTVIGFLVDEHGSIMIVDELASSITQGTSASNIRSAFVFKEVLS